MADIRFERATRIYPGTDAPAVDALDLHIADAELMVLVGPSGSGKSTALRMLAGLEDVDDGGIWIGDRDVTYVRPRDRDVAMVFQNYALYPYLTVAQNIAFPLKMARRLKRSERDLRVREVAELLGLTDLLERKPGQLSGGQRQRVAMGRAIVRSPTAYLMDEPLSNLDAKLRVQMRADIADLQARLGVTTVYVTHDQSEAMTLGSRVAVLRDGRLQQCAPPRELYDRPANAFVAGFIGSPAMSLSRSRSGRTARSTSAASDCRFPTGRRPRRRRAASRGSSSGSAPSRSGSRATASPRASRQSRCSAPTRTSSARRRSAGPRPGSPPARTPASRRSAATRCASPPRAVTRISSIPRAVSGSLPDRGLGAAPDAGRPDALLRPPGARRVTLTA